MENAAETLPAVDSTLKVIVVAGMHCGVSESETVPLAGKGRSHRAGSTSK